MEGLVHSCHAAVATGLITLASFNHGQAHLHPGVFINNAVCVAVQGLVRLSQAMMYRCQSRKEQHGQL